MTEVNVSLEPGTGVFLWMYEPEDEARWGGNPVDFAVLPISDELRSELERLGAWFDTSLNWSYPPDPGPWRQDECDRFTQATSDAVGRLRAELGPSWEVIASIPSLREDPDLDRYLADPAGFRRFPAG